MNDVMNRIRLNKSEKKMMHILNNGEQGNWLALRNDERYLAIRSLQGKGLVDAVIDYNVIVDVKLSYAGKAYMAENPTLKNPVNWGECISLFVAIVSVIASVIALFISCAVL